MTRAAGRSRSVGRVPLDSDSDENTSESESSTSDLQPLVDEEYFPRIVAIFYSIFHPTQGPTVVYQVPEGSIACSAAKTSSASKDATRDAQEKASGIKISSSPSARSSADSSDADSSENDSEAFQSQQKRLAKPLFEFKTLSEYIIPKAALCGRLLSCTIPATRIGKAQHAQSYKILSHPIILYDQAKYPRNSFVFNLAFVFEGRADVRSYEPIVRKCARELSDLEQASSFLSKSQFRMYEVIEQLFQDLNSYYESFVALPYAPHSKYVTTLADNAIYQRGVLETTRNWADVLRKQHTASNADAKLHRDGIKADEAGSRNLLRSSAAGRQRGKSILHSEGAASSLRPPARRSSTDVPAAESIMPREKDAEGHFQQELEVATSALGDRAEADPSRPGLNRAKTLAGLALSDANAVGESSLSQTQEHRAPTTSPPLLGRRESSATSSSLSSAREMLIRTSTNDALTFSEQSNFVDATERPRPTIPDRSDSQYSRQSDTANSAGALSMSRQVSISNVSNGVGSTAPASVLAPGKREPPHGLGRTVRDAINVKLFPTHPNPPEVNDWDVPVTLLELKSRRNDNWDLTMIRILPFINGINHVKRIAQLADADLELTRQCIEHLLFYRCIIIVDTFQFSNIYTVRPTIANLAEDEIVMTECASYVTRKGYSMPSWPKLLRLYSSLRPSLTINDWIDDYDVDDIGIDVRRFITFGIIKGFLRRVHRYPVLLSGTDEPVVDAREPSSSRSRSRDRLAALRVSEPSFAKSDGSPRARTETRDSSVGSTSISSQRPSASPRQHPRRRLGIPLAQGQTQHHRQTQATVMDVAHVAYDAAKGLAGQEARRHDGSFGSNARGVAHGDDLGNSSGRFGRTPLTRHTSSSTIRPAHHTRLSGREEMREASGTFAGGSSGGTRHRHSSRNLAIDSAATSSGSNKALRIPPEMIYMLDGMHPDDAFCVRFGRSWHDIIRMLSIIGHSTFSDSLINDRGTPRGSSSGFSTLRGRKGVSEDMANSAFRSVPSVPDDGGVGDSGFYQMSGIWGLGAAAGQSGFHNADNPIGARAAGTGKGIRKTGIPDIETGQGTSGNSAAERAAQGSSNTVTFPHLPRYRPSESGSSNVPTTAPVRQQNSVKQGSSSLGLSSGSMALSNQSIGPEDPIFDRRRYAQGDLGRVQIIMK